MNLDCNLFGATVWMEISTRGRSHTWPHPKGKRWAVVREDEEEGYATSFYLGPVFFMWTPRQADAQRRSFSLVIGW